jgi:hypothetical protein
MTTLREGDLELRVPSRAIGRKFDDASHGLSHCMKAVDFVVELPDRILFVEVKDPENPAATCASRAEFIRRFQSGEIDRDLALKYRDSFLYEWAANRLAKPVHYVVLVAIATMDAAMLLTRSDALKGQLPFDGPSNGAWTRRIAAQCIVLNIDAWNRHLPSFPVKRLGP